MGFVIIYKYNSSRLEVINRDHRLAEHTYSLSLRFQLEENVRSMKVEVVHLEKNNVIQLLKTAFYLLGIQNIIYAGIYAISSTEYIRSIENGWISQLLDTLFNFFVATDGIIVAVVTFLTDPTYVVVVKNLKYIG